jgi:hypothetical protein
MSATDGAAPLPLAGVIIELLAATARAPIGADKSKQTSLHILVIGGFDSSC